MIAQMCAWRLTHRGPRLLRVVCERRLRVAVSHGLCAPCSARLRADMNERKETQR